VEKEVRFKHIFLFFAMIVILLILASSLGKVYIDESDNKWFIKSIEETRNVLDVQHKQESIKIDSLLNLQKENIFLLRLFIEKNGTKRVGLFKGH